VAGEHPHRKVKLLECLLDGGEQQSGGAVSGRSTAMAAVEELGALGFLRWNDSYGLGEKLGRGRSYMGWLQPWRAGPRCRAGGAVPDRGRTWARVRAGRGEGNGPDRRDPPVSERKRERGRSRPRGEGGPGESCWAAWRRRKRCPWAGLRREREREEVKPGQLGSAGGRGKDGLGRAAREK
jgi:hypothetical protein